MYHALRSEPPWPGAVIVSGVPKDVYPELRVYQRLKPLPGNFTWSVVL